MGGTSTLIKDFKLAGSKSGVISVSHVTKPYGEDSSSVVSIGVSLNGESGKPEWKAHIPYDNIEDVIDALKEAKEKYSHED